MRRRDREEGFRTYVREYRPQLVRIATLLGSGDAHTAEDLVQVALTRLYVNWHRLEGGRSPHAYTRRILVNTFIDERRRPAYHRERSSAVVPEPDLPWGGESRVEERDFVLAALAELPPRMRAAVVLRHWLQLDVRETADHLGCSEGTVKSQTARGLERLRSLLPTEPTSP